MASDVSGGEQLRTRLAFGLSGLFFLSCLEASVTKLGCQPAVKVSLEQSSRRKRHTPKKRNPNDARLHTETVQIQIDVNPLITRARTQEVSYLDVV